MKKFRIVGSAVLSFMLVTSTGTVSAEEAEVEGEVAPSVDEVRYIELKPTFVTNYGVSESGRLSYIKADVTVRVAGRSGEYATKTHLPALRNSLVLLFSRQDESTISSTAGRETIKAQALAELREILTAEEGDGHIEELMFTNFVVQR